MHAVVSRVTTAERESAESYLREQSGTGRITGPWVCSRVLDV